MRFIVRKDKHIAELWLTNREQSEIEHIVFENNHKPIFSYILHPFHG
ncbi:MAG: hypothetical protein ACI4J7_03080 [Ruminiclostridium sp.]